MKRIDAPPSPSARPSKGVSKSHLWAGVVAAAVLPWAAAWWLVPDKRIDWRCLSDVEFDTRLPDGAQVRVYGKMESDYHRDGTGTARFAGRLQQGDALHVVHRASEFQYVALDSMMRVNTMRASRLTGDDAPDDQVYRFVYRGFQPGHTDYFQTMRVGEGASVGFNNEPRVYCAPAPLETAK